VAVKLPDALEEQINRRDGADHDIEIQIQALFNDLGCN
jgi:hypothetical protein